MTVILSHKCKLTQNFDCVASYQQQHLIAIDKFGIKTKLNPETRGSTRFLSPQIGFDWATEEIWTSQKD